MTLTLPLLALTAACGAVSLSGGNAPPTAPSAGIAPAPGVMPDGPDTCGRAQFEGLIGQPVGDAAAFRDAGVTFRVIYPGDPVTDDFVAGRLNVYATALGTIESLDCF